MYKRATISILLMVMVLTSGCVDATYKTEVSIKIGIPTEPAPKIIGDSRFHHAKPEVKKEVVKPKRGFAKFNN